MPSESKPLGNHGIISEIILLFEVFAFSWRIISKAFRIKAPVES